MILELLIPSPGESISEAEIAAWLVEEGDFVEKDQEVAEIESEKATLPLIAEQDGRIHDLAPIGESLKVGAVACKIDTSATGIKKKTVAPKPAKKESIAETETPVKEPIAKPVPAASQETVNGLEKVKTTPVSEKVMQELHLSVEDIINGLRRITKKDVEAAVSGLKEAPSAMHSKPVATRETATIKLTQLRKKLSERLVAVKNETATLTTFNEVDMSEIIRLRKTYQSKFQEHHGIKLGFMSFFTKAVSLALQQFPQVNSMIDGDSFVQFKYSDVGIAVQTNKGLMVPVIRNTGILGLADIEKKIMELAEKARINRISIEDLAGGTFTITNGGVFGSMLSTPILNPPQAAILGMHNIVERPVAINGKVEIRPIMYLALSYDHRIVDGRDSVGFLVAIKGFIENPASMLLPGKNPDLTLLGI